MAIRAYVDGFNLYRTLLQGRPDLKWLNFEALWSEMFPDLAVDRTYFFTARVHALPTDKGAPIRQQKYIDALKSTPSVEVVWGNFSEDTVVTRPVSGGVRDRIEVYRNREKGSDVNLASCLLRDTYERTIETALVVTNDSDLRAPIAIARAAGVRVIVCSPTARPSSALIKAASEQYVLATRWLGAAQFPHHVSLAGGRTTLRPREWR